MLFDVLRWLASLAYWEKVRQNPAFFFRPVLAVVLGYGIYRLVADIT